MADGADHLSRPNSREVAAAAGVAGVSRKGVQIPALFT
jgi:hypothetical protein